MESPWQQMQPKDTYLVKKAGPLTSEEQKVLTFLYQPIIGMAAYSLFMTLWSEVVDEQKESEFRTHTQLISMLDIELPLLYNARNRLEGIGLLKTFVQTFEMGARSFLYEIQAPLTPEKIFRDDIFGLLLLERVGEKRFDQLIQEFSFSPVDTTSYTEITKKFLDVYHFQPNHLYAAEDQLLQAKKIFAEKKVERVTWQNKTFDWNFFTSLLEPYYIQKDSLTTEVKESIFALHELYGLDELTMQRMVGLSMDYVTNTINLKELKKNIYTDYHQEKPQKVNQNDSEKKENLSKKEKQTYRANSLKMEQFSEGDIEVVLASEALSPMNFLRSIKDQKGGFVSNDERWTVEMIKQQSQLPNAVINVLIHYILVVQGNASLNQKFANTIANDWAQSKIYSPEAAIKKVKELQLSKNTTKNKKKYQPSSKRKESLPDWVHQETKEEELLSDVEKQKFEDRIRKITNEGE